MRTANQQVMYIGRLAPMTGEIGLVFHYSV